MVYELSDTLQKVVQRTAHKLEQYVPRIPTEFREEVTGRLERAIDSLFKSRKLLAREIADELSCQARGKHLKTGLRNEILDLAHYLYNGKFPKHDSFKYPL